MKEGTNKRSKLNIKNQLHTTQIRLKNKQSNKERHRDGTNQVKKRGRAPATRTIVTLLRGPPIQCGADVVIIGESNRSCGVYEDINRPMLGGLH